MSQVRTLYKELLRTAQLLPKIQSDAAILEIRTKFHQNMNENNPEKVESFIHEADSRLKFMMMITPRRHSQKAEYTIYRVNDDGKLEEGRGKCSDGAHLGHFGMVTDEMRFINEQQLRRMSYLPYKKRS